MIAMFTDNRMLIGRLFAAVLVVSLLLSVVGPNRASAYLVIAGDDFEGDDDSPTGFGWLGEWSLTGDAEIDDENPHQGEQHLYLEEGGSSAIRSLDVTAESGLSLKFWAKAHASSGDAVVEASTDGSSFTELHRWNSDTQYSQFDIDLTPLEPFTSNQLWIRFRILGGGNGDDEDERDDDDRDDDEDERDDDDRDDDEDERDDDDRDDDEDERDDDDRDDDEDERDDDDRDDDEDERDDDERDNDRDDEGEDEGDDDQGEGRLFIDEIEIAATGQSPDPPPTSDTDIIIDGQFSDWEGKANLPDPFDDQIGSSIFDVAALYWANNIDQEINFHMIERHTTDGQPFDGSNGQGWLARYMLYIDTNNNGDYTDDDDRRAVITYVATGHSSAVNVRIYEADSSEKISDSGWNDWGDSMAEGALRVEFPLDWTDLGIEFGDVIRMYAVSFSGLSFDPHVRDRVPDGNADIQWSPASVLGPWLLAVGSIAGIAVIWYISRRRKLWT